MVEIGAQIGTGVSIGPFCYVSKEAVIGDGVELKNHVSVLDRTTIGEGTIVGPQVVLGGMPQNFAHKDGPTTLNIGKHCVIREFVTMHRGSDNSRGATDIGDNGYFMAYSHVAHDCVIGPNVVMANGATLGGHCVLGDHVNIGGLTAVHQFVRIGHHAFLGGCSAIVGDVIPYGIAMGNRATLRGFNIVGMKRSGMDRQQIKTMREAYRRIFDSHDLMAENAAAVAKEYSENALIVEIANFLLERGRRYYCVPKRETSKDGESEKVA